jgi:hypothetical protein
MAKPPSNVACITRAREWGEGRGEEMGGGGGEGGEGGDKIARG